ncbi:MAG TPA: hypothetical protein VK989_09050, partial [Polyangia bacterium]|nr:hypothetical protein [Polyangia bacterium]
MNIDVSTALATLQLDPDNPQALKALADLQPTADFDAAAVQQALGDARRWHRERGDFELVLQLIEVELTWTKDAARRADLLHEKGRLLSDDLLRGEAGLAAVQQALEALPSHGPSKESAAQMSLMRGNWRPISKRYLQQAQEAEAAGKDAAHAASLFVSVAELLLKYGGDEAASHVDAEAHLRKSRALDPTNRRSGAHVERLLRDESRWDELITLYTQRAEAATAREDRALAEVLAGEVGAKIGKNDEALAHFRKALEASPNESRALRPVRAALTRRGGKGDAQAWAELAKVLEAAVRTKRGEQDVLLQVD